MNIFILGSLVMLGVLLFGLALAFLMARLSTMVVTNSAEVEALQKERKALNPKLTGGHPIQPSTDVAEQMEQARKLAAKRAAALPRGSNLGIGRLETTDARADKKTASLGTAADPMTAVKIAAFHTWKGLRYVPPAAPAPAAARPAAGAPRPAAQPTQPAAPAVTLIPITDDMSPADKRKAIIANAKAQAAAAKAAKAAGLPAPTAEAAPSAPAATAPAVAAPTLPAGVEPPQLIEITDDMSPADKRKAIIANSKAKAAYAKALKAAGYDPGALDEAAPTSVAEPLPAAVAEPAAAAAPVANLPPAPDLIPITEGMDPAALRQARIANAKALSAYNKQLKELGIDPASVKLD